MPGVFFPGQSMAGYHMFRSSGRCRLYPLLRGPDVEKTGLLIPRAQPRLSLLL
jgi:hypothetical protein